MTRSAVRRRYSHGGRCFGSAQMSVGYFFFEVLSGHGYRETLFPDTCAVMVAPSRPTIKTPEFSVRYRLAPGELANPDRGLVTVGFVESILKVD